MAWWAGHETRTDAAKNTDNLRLHTEALASDAEAHADRLAREAREQDRFADAYIDVLAIALKWSEYIRFLRNPPYGVEIEYPTLAEQHHVFALAQGYGTPEVRRLLYALQSAVLEARRYSYEEIDGMWHLQGETDETRAERQRHYDTVIVEAVMAARDALGEQVSNELAQRAA